MIEQKDYKKIQAQLREFLVAAFPDVDVRIGDDIHYRGTNVVVTTSRFDGLLPEQRYHHVVHAVPADFYESYLRGGVVWFELAPGETGKAYMGMPRSRDAADRAEAIASRLGAIGFFDQFRARQAASGAPASEGDFVEARRILGKAGCKEDEILEIFLYFLLQGAFCDAELPPRGFDSPAESTQEGTRAKDG